MFHFKCKLDLVDAATQLAEDGVSFTCRPQHLTIAVENSKLKESTSKWLSAICQNKQERDVAIEKFKNMFREPGVDYAKLSIEDTV